MRRYQRGARAVRPSKRAVHTAMRFYAKDEQQAAQVDELFGGPLKPRRERAERAGPTEHQEQVAVVQWWAQACRKWELPDFALMAIPNGGARDVITGARLKAEGVRRGAPDLVLTYPTPTYSGLFIEMKVGDNKPSPDQKLVLQHLNEIGYKAVVHWSADAAIQEISEYLNSARRGLSLMSGAPDES